MKRSKWEVWQLAGEYWGKQFYGDRETAIAYFLRNSQIQKLICPHGRLIAVRGRLEPSESGEAMETIWLYDPNAIEFD